MFLPNPYLNYLKKTYTPRVGGRAFTRAHARTHALMRAREGRVLMRKMGNLGKAGKAHS